MATYRYRLIRTMYDKVVGVAVQPPGGGLMLRLGQKDLDFDPRTAPKLESLDLYVHELTAKPEARALQVDNLGPVRRIELDRFVSLANFQQKVENLADD